MRTYFVVIKWESEEKTLRRLKEELEKQGLEMVRLLTKQRKRLAEGE